MHVKISLYLRVLEAIDLSNMSFRYKDLKARKRIASAGQWLTILLTTPSEFCVSVTSL